MLTSRLATAKWCFILKNVTRSRRSSSGSLTALSWTESPAMLIQEAPFPSRLTVWTLARWHLFAAVSSPPEAESRGWCPGWRGRAASEAPPQARILVASSHLQHEDLRVSAEEHEPKNRVLLQVFSVSAVHQAVSGFRWVADVNRPYCCCCCCVRARAGC